MIKTNIHHYQHCASYFKLCNYTSIYHTSEVGVDHRSRILIQQVLNFKFANCTSYCIFRLELQIVELEQEREDTRRSVSEATAAERAAIEPLFQRVEEEIKIELQ